MYENLCQLCIMQPTNCISKSPYRKFLHNNPNLAVNKQSNGILDTFKL